MSVICLKEVILDLAERMQYRYRFNYLSSEWINGPILSPLPLEFETEVLVTT
jgi:hypothetical protein